MRIALISGLASLTSPWVLAQSEEELTTMTLERLMNVQVTSVSRREETLQRTAAAVYVITREDIRRSGSTDIADLLRMVPGVHVAQLNGNVWAISARGFASQYATKMLVLVDGRSVYDPSFSGVFWHLQNLALVDIDRIEVIRGPGATMWGSNAVNGVISITTKSAADTQKGLLTFDAGTARPGEGTLRYGGTLGKSAFYRVYGRQTTRSSLAKESGGDAGDAWDLTTGGFRLDWDISSKDSLTLETTAYRGGQGSRQSILTSLAPLTYETVGRTGNDGAHVRARYSRSAGEDSRLDFKFYYDRRDHTGYGAKTLEVIDFETQYDFHLGERHRVTMGGGHREIHDVFENSLSFGVAEPDLDSNLSSVYLQDQFSLVEDKLYFTVGSKLERSSYTGYNVQPTVRLSWLPTFRHTIWGSASRAVRTANRIERGMYVNWGTFEAGPALGLVTLFGQEDTQSEELSAFEAGYRYQSNRRLWLDVTGFYNVYDHLSTVEPGTTFFDAAASPPHLVVPLYFGNEMTGKTYGAEAAVNYYVSDFWTLRGSYSLLEMELGSYPGLGDLASAALTEGTAPHQQAYVGAFVTLPLSFELDGQAYFVDRLRAADIPAYTRVDLNLTWSGHDKLELSLVGQNLLGAHEEFDDYEGTPTSVIDRRIFGRVAWSF